MSTLNRDLPLIQPLEPPQTRWRLWLARWGWGIAAAGLPLIFYLFTMAPTVYGLDSAELTTGAYTLGIVHPPGSPLFLLIGHLFTWLPVGDVGFRVNLLSVVSGTVMAGFLYLILYELIRGRWLALTATWLCAFSYFIWINALATELYALQVAWLTGLLWLALRWRTAPRSWQLPLFTFLFSLGLGNHLSLILLLPGFLVLLFIRTKREVNSEQLPVNSGHHPSVHRTGLPFTIHYSPFTIVFPSGSRLSVAQSLFIAAATGLLGILIYLYLPIRYLALDNLNYARDYWGIDLTTWHGFSWMVSGRIFGSLFLGVPWQQWPGEFLTFFSQLFSNYWGLGFLLGLGGLISDWRRRPVLQLALLLMFLLHIGFYITYRVVDKQFMYGPAYLIWAIWLAIGAQRLHEWLSSKGETRQHGNTAILQPSPHHQWRPFVSLLMGSLVLAALFINFPLVNVSNDWSAREQGEYIFTALPEDAVFFGTWLDVPILEYLQRVEGQRPDVTTRNLVFIGRGRAPVEATQRLEAGQTVYTSNRKWFSEGQFEFIRDESCRCYRVQLP